jgi:hypothetical protein
MTGFFIDRDQCLLKQHSDAGGAVSSLFNMRKPDSCDVTVFQLFVTSHQKPLVLPPVKDKSVCLSICLYVVH